jgi:heme-degrading monooxygenase HmoA
MVSGMARGRRRSSVAVVHALFLTYSLERSTAAEHAEFAEELTPAIEAVPGLVDHRRLANDAAGRYGAFYVFDTRLAFDRFVSSELFAALCCHRAVSDCVTSDFAVDAPRALASTTPGSLA